VRDRSVRGSHAGYLDIVKAILTADPEARKYPGPARQFPSSHMPKREAAEVVAYLESLSDAYSHVGVLSFKSEKLCPFYDRASVPYRT